MRHEKINNEKIKVNVSSKSQKQLANLHKANSMNHMQQPTVTTTIYNAIMNTSCQK